MRKEANRYAGEGGITFQGSSTQQGQGMANMGGIGALFGMGNNTNIAQAGRQAHNPLANPTPPKPALANTQGIQQAALSAQKVAEHSFAQGYTSQEFGAHAEPREDPLQRALSIIKLSEVTTGEGNGPGDVGLSGGNKGGGTPGSKRSFGTNPASKGTQQNSSFTQQGNAATKPALGMNLGTSSPLGISQMSGGINNGWANISPGTSSPVKMSMVQPTPGLTANMPVDPAQQAQAQAMPAQDPAMAAQGGAAPPPAQDPAQAAQQGGGAPPLTPPMADAPPQPLPANPVPPKPTAQMAVASNGQPVEMQPKSSYVAAQQARLLGLLEDKQQVAPANASQAQEDLNDQNFAFGKAAARRDKGPEHFPVSHFRLLNSEVSEGKHNWMPRLTPGEHTPAKDMLADPVKNSLLAGLLGAGIGGLGGAGISHLTGGDTLTGAGVGAGMGGVLGGLGMMSHRMKKNDEISDKMRYLTPNATVGDLNKLGGDSKYVYGTEGDGSKYVFGELGALWAEKRARFLGKMLGGLGRGLQRTATGMENVVNRAQPLYHMRNAMHTGGNTLGGGAAGGIVGGTVGGLSGAAAGLGEYMGKSDSGTPVDFGDTVGRYTLRGAGIGAGLGALGGGAAGFGVSKALPRPAPPPWKLPLPRPGSMPPPLPYKLPIPPSGPGGPPPLPAGFPQAQPLGRALRAGESAPTAQLARGANPLGDTTLYAPPAAKAQAMAKPSAPTGPDHSMFELDNIKVPTRGAPAPAPVPAPRSPVNQMGPGQDYVNKLNAKAEAMARAANPLPPKMQVRMSPEMRGAEPGVQRNHLLNQLLNQGVPRAQATSTVDSWLAKQAPRAAAPALPAKAKVSVPGSVRGKDLSVQHQHVLDDLRLQGYSDQQASVAADRWLKQQATQASARSAASAPQPPNGAHPLPSWLQQGQAAAAPLPAAKVPDNQLLKFTGYYQSLGHSNAEADALARSAMQQRAAQVAAEAGRATGGPSTTAPINTEWLQDFTRAYGTPKVGFDFMSKYAEDVILKDGTNLGDHEEVADKLAKKFKESAQGDRIAILVHNALKEKMEKLSTCDDDTPGKVDPRVKCKCPRCGSDETVGARSSQKSADGSRSYPANAHCYACDEGFSYNFDTGETTKRAAQANDGSLQLKRSATGESKGLTFNHREDDYSQGQAAWSATGKYFRNGKDKEPNPFKGDHNGTTKQAGMPGAQMWRGALDAGRSLLGMGAKAAPKAAPTAMSELTHAAKPLGMLGGFGGHYNPALATGYKGLTDTAKQLPAMGLKGWLGGTTTGMIMNPEYENPTWAGVADPRNWNAAQWGGALASGAMGHKGMAGSRVGQAFQPMWNRAVTGGFAGGTMDNLVGVTGLDTHNAGARLGAMAGFGSGLAANRAFSRSAQQQASRLLNNVNTQGMTPEHAMRNIGQTAAMTAKGQGPHIAAMNQSLGGQIGKGMDTVYEGSMAPFGWAGRKAIGGINRATGYNAGNMDKSYKWWQGLNDYMKPPAVQPGMQQGLRTLGAAGTVAPLAAMGGAMGYGMLNNKIDQKGNEMAARMYNEAMPQMQQDFTGMADDWMRQRGLINQEGQFDPSQGISQGISKGVGNLMGGTMGHVDKIFQALGMDPSRMSPIQKTMILGGAAGVGGGALMGSPAVATLGSGAMLGGLIPSVMSSGQQQPGQPYYGPGQVGRGGGQATSAMDEWQKQLLRQ